MSDIYRGAGLVLVWLGCRQEVTRNGTSTYLDLSHNLSKDRDPERQNVRRFLQNPYFDRLWIIQEILLARNITVLIGNKCLPWSSLLRLINTRPMLFDSNSEHALTLLRMSSRRNFDPLTIIEALDKFATMECSDPRDKVYGIIGIMDGEHGLQVDYSKPAHQFHLDVYGAVLRQMSTMEHTTQVQFEACYKVLSHLRDQTKIPGTEMFYGPSYGMMEDVWREWFSKKIVRRSIIMDYEPAAEMDREGRWWYQIDDDQKCYYGRARYSSNTGY